MRSAYVLRVLAIAGALTVLASCASSAQTVPKAQSVHITRSPGMFILPPIDQTIADATVANRLATDIENLPAAPTGPMACPVDFGTSYKLEFVDVGGGGWTAVVAALGCQTVTLSDGRILLAVGSPQLFSDLGSALGLAPDELMPMPCPAPGRTHCYPQPIPPSA